MWWSNTQAALLKKSCCASPVMHIAANVLIELILQILTTTYKIGKTNILNTIDKNIMIVHVLSI